MKKIAATLLIMCMLFCLTACCQNENLTDSTKETENVTIDKNYNDALDLIASAKYEEAYDKIKDIKDTEIAEELRNKFVVIENILLSKTIIIPDDKFGNKIGPYTVNYYYDINGNMAEVNAKDVPIIHIQRKAVNHLMKYVHVLNYHPYHEKLTYDEDNKLTKITGYSKDSEKIIYTADFIYDEKGNNNKVEYTYNHGAIETFFEYNQKGKIVKVQGVREGNVEITNAIEYDVNGNVIEEGTVYDDKGNIIESKTYYYGGGTTTEAKCVWNYGNFYIYNE